MQEKYDPDLIKYRDLIIEMELLKLKSKMLNERISEIERILYDRIDKAILLINEVEYMIEGKNYHEIQYSLVFHKLEIARTILESVEDILKEVGIL